MRDLRDCYIDKVAKGKTFADIGGLWGTVNEKVSVAYACGASSLTMIDISPPESELWSLFEDRRRTSRLPEVHCISSDILVLAEGSACPQFDVVHCSGILYHIPDPIGFLVALRKITREHLVLTSVVTATKVESEQGILELPEASALFIPALQKRERAILKSYWQRFVGDGAIGLTGDAASWQTRDFAPWWWLPTVEVLKMMCIAAGFDCEEAGYIWNENAYVQLLAARTEQT